MQESEAESADMVLRELNRQIHSRQMELYFTCQVREARQAQSRVGKPRKSASRNSYWNSSRSGRIEKGFAVLKLRELNS